MAITEKDIKHIRKKLSESTRPLFFFDDDPDGLSSFLLLYKYVGDGRGIPIKTSPEMNDSYLSKVESYSPDLIVILDKPLVSQEFLDKVSVPIIWIDHHQPVKRHKVEYFNPRIEDNKDNRPTTYWAYKIVKENLWIATVGCVSDWFIPDFIKKFEKEHPGMLPKEYSSPPEILFGSKLGEISKVFSFILKGKNKDVITAIKILTRIKKPEEILSQTTAQGKFIYKKYNRANNEYKQLLSEVQAPKGKLLVHTYLADRTSYTAEMSNELLYQYPNILLIIGRIKDDEVRCSLRSGKIPVEPMLKKALMGIEGYGGGHEYACGACIKKEDFERFIGNIKEELKKIE